MKHTFINQAEKNLLFEIDRLVKWHDEQNKPLEKIQVSKRQYDALMRLAKKAESGPLYDDEGRVDLTPQGILEGVQIYYERPKRRRYRKKDTAPMF